MTDSEKIGAMPRKSKSSDDDALDSGKPSSLTGIFCESKGFFAFMGAVFVLLRSDIYQENVLSKIKGTVDYSGTTGWGEFVTLLIYMFLLIMGLTLARKGII